MASNTGDHIAIIGMGLAGLGLAIALQAKNIPCKIYELRGPSYSHHGALMLSPNSLSILDKLGVYSRIRDRGFHFENVIVKTASGETTDQYAMGNERLYGYKALRIYRRVLINELQAIAQERGIEIQFEKKYSHVVSEENDKGVEFAFADGTAERARLLIGTDGIYSKVRQHVAPGIAPKYSGFVAITYAVKRELLRLPPGEDLSCPVTWSGRHGAFVLAPQDVDGREFLAGKQVAYPEQDRAGWDALSNDKDKLLAVIRKGLDDENDLVQSALENIDPATFIIWPFYTMPRLERWISVNGKVLIMGDAAHAVPPTAGQGANQAFEDAYTFAMLVAGLSEDESKITPGTAIEFWQKFREDRVDEVIKLTGKLNNMRLPTEEKEKLDQRDVWHEDKSQPVGGQMSWLFLPRLEEKVEAWIREQNRQ